MNSQTSGKLVGIAIFLPATASIAATVGTLTLQTYCVGPTSSVGESAVISATSWLIS